MSHSSSDLAKCYLFPVFKWELLYPNLRQLDGIQFNLCKKVAFFTLVAPTLPKVETISQSNDANFLTEVSNSNKGSVVV